MPYRGFRRGSCLQWCYDRSWGRRTRNIRLVCSGGFYRQAVHQDLVCGGQAIFEGRSLARVLAVPSQHRKIVLNVVTIFGNINKAGTLRHRFLQTALQMTCQEYAGSQPILQQEREKLVQAHEGHRCDLTGVGAEHRPYCVGHGAGQRFLPIGQQGLVVIFSNIMIRPAPIARSSMHG